MSVIAQVILGYQKYPADYYEDSYNFQSLGIDR